MAKKKGEKAVYISATPETIEFGNPQTFRSGIGKFRTVSLFKETLTVACHKAGIKPIFSLRNIDYPHQGILALHKLIVATNDPTGYEAAMAIFGDWHYFQMLQTNPKINECIQGALEEIEVRLRSEAIQGMRNNITSSAAQKWVAERGWDLTHKNSKASKEKEERQKKVIIKNLQADGERILAAVGGKGVVK